MNRWSQTPTEYHQDCEDGHPENIAAYALFFALLVIVGLVGAVVL